MEQREAVTNTLYYLEEYVAFIFESIIIEHKQKKQEKSKPETQVDQLDQPMEERVNTNVSTQGINYF